MGTHSTKDTALKTKTENHQPKTRRNVKKGTRFGRSTLKREKISVKEELASNSHYSLQEAFLTITGWVQKAC